MRDAEELSLRDHLEQVMPEGGRARRLLGLGVVAWSAIGGAVLLWVLGRVLERLAGIFPYLVVAGLVVLLLNPPLRRLTCAPTDGTGKPKSISGRPRLLDATCTTFPVSR